MLKQPMVNANYSCESKEQAGRALFEKMYKDSFKKQISLEPLKENESSAFSLNFYGIKSNWL